MTDPRDTVKLVRCPSCNDGTVRYASEGTSFPCRRCQGVRWLVQGEEPEPAPLAPWWATALIVAIVAGSMIAVGVA